MGLDKGRRTVNPALLAAIIAGSHAWIAHSSNMSVHAPEKGPWGPLRSEDSRGVIEGVLGALGVPIAFITPASWKRALGLAGASKDASRSEAIKRWPSQAALFARVKDDGRADAALIAVAGMMKSRSETE